MPVVTDLGFIDGVHQCWRWVISSGRLDGVVGRRSLREGLKVSQLLICISIAVERGEGGDCVRMHGMLGPKALAGRPCPSLIAP